MQVHSVKTAFVALFILSFGGQVFAADQPQWGEHHTRNMISSETGLPATFNPETGENILWSVPTGGSYASPIVAQGKVFVGANNSNPADPKHQGDRAVMLCLNETDGALRWQLVVPRIGGDDYLDWPNVGISSEPTVENDRVYTVTNRGEVVCLDIHGMENGNDGLYLDEGRHMTPADQDALEPGPTDADILWLFDMRAGVGMYPHDAPHVSILMDGEYLYLNTCNGVDNTHRKVGNPDAPSLIVLNKHTGALIAQDGENIGPRIFHSIWSSPSLGEVNGQRLVFFGGPDGVVYAFKALPPNLAEDKTRLLERVWRFDCDPDAPKENVHHYTENSKEGPSEIMGMPVFYNNRIYVTVTGDIWWGKYEASLRCIDAAQTGDVTATAQIWSYPLKRNSCATPAIHNGLLFVTDGSGQVHCVDAETGEGYWTEKIGNRIWASPMVADNKVYVGALSGDFAVFAADKTLHCLLAAKFDAEINGTLTAANGTLYIATLNKIYAIRR